MGVGYDQLDRVALAKREVVVCNVPGSLFLYPSITNFFSRAIRGER
jgi:hypothetical protein